MVSDEIRRDGLAALSIAAVELIEDHHSELVTGLSEDRTAQRERMQRLRRLGADLLALGEAGLVLINDPARAVAEADIRPAGEGRRTSLG